MTLIEFECRGFHFALPLACVRGVVSSAMPTPLPGAPDIVLGVINVRGEVVTVVDFWQRAGLTFPGIGLSQQLLIVTVADALLGFIVDAVLGVSTHVAKNIAAVTPPFNGPDFVNGIVTLENGLRVIVDPEKFLFPAERLSLDDALRAVCDES